MNIQDNAVAIVDDIPWAVNGGTARVMVKPGLHAVILTALAANCGVDGAATREVYVASGATAEIAFNVVCAAPTVVEIVTTGASPR